MRESATVDLEPANEGPPHHKPGTLAHHPSLNEAMTRVAMFEHCYGRDGESSRVRASAMRTIVRM
jgi:hypothetical protein